MADMLVEQDPNVTDGKFEDVSCKCLACGPAGLEIAAQSGKCDASASPLGKSCKAANVTQGCRSSGSRLTQP